MRALCSVIVVCLVALGGAGRADARGESRGPAPACRAAPEGVAHAVATRPVLHAVSARGRAADRRLLSVVSVVLGAAAVSFHTPPRCALALPSVARARAVVRLIATGSARGPPIA